MFSEIIFNVLQIDPLVNECAMNATVEYSVWSLSSVHYQSLFYNLSHTDQSEHLSAL